MYVIIQIVVIEIGGSTKSARGWRGGGQYCPHYWFNKFIKKTRNIHIVLNKTVTACCPVCKVYCYCVPNSLSATVTEVFLILTYVPMCYCAQRTTSMNNLCISFL